MRCRNKCFWGDDFAHTSYLGPLVVSLSLGDDYKSHTSCISEAQKYGGKESSDKGLKKQNAWIESIQGAIKNAQADDPRVNDILENLSAFSNLPQKKHKFVNFLKNSFPR